jgi:hypothetical protein
MMKEAKMGYGIKDILYTLLIHMAGPEVTIKY